jgi:hypothetical protein
MTETAVKAKKFDLPDNVTEDGATIGIQSTTGYSTRTLDPGAWVMTVTSSNGYDGGSVHLGRLIAYIRATPELKHLLRPPSQNGEPG